MHGLLTMCALQGCKAEVVSSLQALEDDIHKSLTQTRPWEQNFARAITMVANSNKYTPFGSRDVSHTYTCARTH